MSIVSFVVHVALMLGGMTLLVIAIGIGIFVCIVLPGIALERFFATLRRKILAFFHREARP